MTEVLEHIWSVDVALSRLAFAFAPLDGSAISIETLHTGGNDIREGQRLGLLDRQVRIYARQLAGSFPPACVWVEQPSGKYLNLPLTYATGVVQAAVYEALACPVWTMPSGRWKKATVGAGNATKAQVAAWVTAQGADFNGQDEADAYAIAAAGRAMFTSGQWEAAAA